MAGVLLPRGYLLADRYEVLSQLGTGASGEVYEVHDEHLDRTCALKLIRPAGGPGGAWTEAQMLVRVQSPFLVPVFDADVVGTSDLRYLTMPVMRGGDLEEAAGGLGAGVGAARRWGAQLAHGLDRVHAAGLLHRDVKPANAFLDDGDVRLGDLGRAAAVDASGSADADGTPVTVAPEVLAPGGRCTVASDVYSVAATCFYLLAGVYPVDGSLPKADQQRLVAAGRRRRLMDVAPHVSRSIRAVVERGLSTDPAARPPSALAFGNALAGASDHGRAWSRVDCSHDHCLKGARSGSRGPVTVHATVHDGRATISGRLETGRRPAGHPDETVRVRDLPGRLRAWTETL